MAKQVINIGQSVNDKTGDPIRTAFGKVNDNFAELYTLTGGTAADLKELAQDYAADMLTSGDHTGISVIYDDGNNKINLTVANQSWAQISGKPEFADVAYSGSFNDLTDIPVGTVVGSTPPSSPGEGEMWYDTNSGRLFIFYNNSWVDASPESIYVLPAASNSTLGGIKVGTNLSIDGNGVLSATATPQVNADWNASSGVAQILHKPTSLNSFTNDPGYLTASDFGNITFDTNLISVSGTNEDLFIGGNGTGQTKTLNGLQVLTLGMNSTPAFTVAPTGLIQVNTPSVPTGTPGALNIVGSGDGSYQPVNGAGGMIHITGNDNTLARITVDGYATATTGAQPAQAGYGLLALRSARGTAAAPAHVLANDILASFSGLGYVGTGGYSTGQVAGLQFFAAEDFLTSSNKGTYAQIKLCPVGGSAGQLAVQFNATGMVVPGTVDIQSTTTSSSAYTGALTVAGGVGINGPMWVNKSIYVSGYNEGFYGGYIGNNNTGEDFTIRSNPNNDGTVHIYGNNVDIHTTNNPNPVFQVKSDGQVVILTPTFDPNQGAFNVVGSTDGSYVAPTSPGTMVHVTGQPGTIARQYIDSVDQPAHKVGRRYNGTSASPLPVNSGEVIARFVANAYNGGSSNNGFAPIGLSFMEIVATEDQTATANGGQINFWTTANGTTTNVNSISIVPTGIQFADDTVQSTAGIPLTQKGQQNGVATLGSDGKVPNSQLPAGSTVYLGTWDASTNSPHLANGSGVAGNEYAVSVSGTVDFGAGGITFSAGDFVIYNGTAWQRIPTAVGVSSFNGRNGVVTLTSSDVTTALTYTPYNGSTNPNGYVNSTGAASAAPVQTVFGRAGNVVLQTSDVTGVLTAGTITNTMLAGSITNAKLVNSSVTVNGTTINLGDTATITAAAGTLTGNTLNATVINSSLSTVGTLNNLTVAGSTSSGTLAATASTTGSASAGAIKYGTLNYADTNILASFSSSVNNYNQIVIQNTNNGSSASANLIVSNNNGSAGNYYGEFGMNSGTYTGTGAFSAPNAVYLSSQTSDLVIATQSNSAIHFVTNGGTNTSDVLTISGAGVATFANTIVGSINGNAGTVTNGVYTTDTGTVTNTMLAGSIANNKLSNSSVTVGTTAIALGASSTTLAGLTSVTSTTFVGALTGNASTVTNGVYTTDTGTVTNTMLAGSIANNKLSNSSVTINGSTISLGGTATITAAAGTLTGTTLNSTVVSSSLTSVGTLSNLTVTNTIIGSISGNAGTVTNGFYTTSSFNIGTTSIAVNRASGAQSLTGISIDGNSGTATKLATARNINGVSFDGTADITVTAAAGTLTGTTLNSTVVTSSLTSVGTLINLTVTNPISGSVTGSSGSTTNLGNTTSTLIGQLSISPSAVNKNSASTQTFTLSGLTTSHKVVITGNTAQTYGCFITSSWASATNTLSVQFMNITGGNITPPTTNISYHAWV
jgi:hypothetical protein